MAALISLNSGDNRDMDMDTKRSTLVSPDSAEIKLPTVGEESESNDVCL